MFRLYLCALLICCAVAVGEASAQGRRVIIYDAVATEVAAPAEAASDLWVTKADLKRATRFEVKPQGVCRDTLCFPLPKAGKSEFIAKKGAVDWFNLSAFARLIKQSVTSDAKHQVWYFGPLAQDAESHLSSLEAPDFSLPDINGKPHSLADYRGKKVLLLTWASW